MKLRAWRRRTCGAGLEAKAAASGAVRLLRKPFETDALIDCLERPAKHWLLIP